MLVRMWTRSPATLPPMESKNANHLAEGSMMNMWLMAPRRLMPQVGLTGPVTALVWLRFLLAVFCRGRSHLFIPVSLTLSWVHAFVGAKTVRNFAKNRDLIVIRNLYVERAALQSDSHFFLFHRG